MNALDPAEFAPLLDRLGPFERPPRLAAAVSGGADSLALCLLADRWARARGGMVQAFTVDHGLRPESAAEAVQAGQWLAGYGIAHHILRWEGEKPAAGIQAAAREARYRLLTAAAAEMGILHLLLAHHQEDQAETLLLRLGRGSGVDGLAAMAPIAELPALRLLRPLLEVPKGRLAATLTALGQPWIEDPSNRDPRFGRIRVRAEIGIGLSAERLAKTALRMGRAREALEQMTARLLAEAVEFLPGHALIDPAVLAPAAPEIGLRALRAVLMRVGGNPYPPRLERLERLWEEIRKGGVIPGRTLSACKIRTRRGRLQISPEV